MSQETSCRGRQNGRQTSRALTPKNLPSETQASRRTSFTPLELIMTTGIFILRDNIRMSAFRRHFILGAASDVRGHRQLRFLSATRNEPDVSFSSRYPRKRKPREGVGNAA